MTEIGMQELFQHDCVAARAIPADISAMANPVNPRFKRPRYRLFLREWREYRGLTQEQLAERAEMSVSNISQLERGIQGYSQDGLEKLADALQCEPGHLHMVNPSKDDAIWSLWEQAQDGQKREIIGFAKGLVRRVS